MPHRSVSTPAIPLAAPPRLAPSPASDHRRCKPSVWSKALALVLGIALIAGLYTGASYYRLYGWLHGDRGSISHFHRMIIEGGHRLNPDGTERDRLIDEALLESQGLGRDVRALSRSEARMEPWGRYAFVKSTMETALPGAPHMTVPITFALRFRVVRGSHIEVLGVDTLRLR